MPGLRCVRPAVPAHICRRQRTFCKLQTCTLLQRHWKLLLKLHKLRGSKGVEAVLLTLQANTASEVQIWQQNKQKLCSCLSPTFVLLYLWCNSQLRAACSLSTTDVSAEGARGESVTSDDKAETANCCAGLWLQQQLSVTFSVRHNANQILDWAAVQRQNSTIGFHTYTLAQVTQSPCFQEVLLFCCLAVSTHWSHRNCK